MIFSLKKQPCDFSVFCGGIHEWILGCGSLGGGQNFSGPVKKFRFPQTWNFYLCKPLLEVELPNPGLTTIQCGWIGAGLDKAFILRLGSSVWIPPLAVTLDPINHNFSSEPYGLFSHHSCRAYTLLPRLASPRRACVVPVNGNGS